MVINILEIEKKKRIRIFESSGIRENFKLISDGDTFYLFESFGVYDKQYEDANLIVSYIIEMIRLGCYEKEYNIKLNDIDIDILRIHIIRNSNSCSDADMLVDGNVLDINIYISPNESVDYNNINQNKLSYKIAHELTHAHIDSRKLKKHLNIDNDPQWYKEVLNILTSNIDSDSIEWRFCFSLYASYYQEIMAFGAQTSEEIENLIFWKKPKEITKELLKNYLCKTSSFETYSIILTSYIKLFKECTFEDIMKISSHFSESLKNDIKNNFEKWIQKIEVGAENGMKKVIQNFNYLLNKYNVI